MATDMFVFQAPYIKSVSKELLADYMSDTDRAYESDLRRICFQFAIKHLLVHPVEGSDTLFKQTTVVDVNSWIYAVNWGNFRSLVNPDQLRFFINRLLTNNSGDMNQPVELAIDLYTRIGCLYDHLFLDMVVNRVMRSISAIPYAVEQGLSAKTWQEIHVEFPWLWCLIYVQSLIRTETVR